MCSLVMRSTCPPSRPPQDATLPNAPTDIQSPGTPCSVGRFEIQSTLGQGGFAKVFLARDPHLNRNVALKVPLPHAIADHAARRRFEREAKAAAILSHPGIVPIYEAGEAGLISYIAFEYCPGPTLATWFASQTGPISTSTVAEIVISIADAVAHAHQRGIVHRDLKPNNILLEVEDQQGKSTASRRLADRLRVSDFGLAQLSSTSDETLTVAGSVVGTPGYMSPEQARGDSTIAPASDVFSLGVMLYQLLTGKRPFSRETQLATLRAIEHDEPPPLTETRSDIPKDLEAICLKCLRKMPNQRYQTAFELCEDLRRWQRGEPIVARSATALEKLSMWRRRNPRLALATSAAIMFLMAGLAGTTWQWRISQRNFKDSLSAKAEAEAFSKEAMDAAENERAARKQAEKIVQFLGNTYRSPDPAKDGRDIRVVDLLARAEGEIAQSFKDEPADRWALLREIGNAYQGLGLIEKANEVYLKLRAEQEDLGTVNLGDAEARESILLLAALAQNTSDAGKFDEAVAISKEAHDRACKRLGFDHPETLRILAGHGVLLQNVNQYPAAEAALRTAIDGLSNENTSVPHFLPMLRGRLGGCLFRQGKAYRSDSDP